jgi:hypothetical protein
MKVKLYDSIMDPYVWNFYKTVDVLHVWKIIISITRVNNLHNIAELQF